MAEFYSARGWEIPPLPWTNVSPPFSGEIEFSPMIAERQWGEASIDLRLGYQITKFKDDLTGITVSVSQGLKSIGSMALWTTKTLKEDDGFGHPEDFVLHPREFILALTLESIKVPRNLIALIEGRSTYAGLD